MPDPDIEDLIKRKYEKILKRDPDKIGLKSILQQIKEGKIRPSDIDDILRNSKEYQDLQKIQQKSSIPEPNHIFVSCFNNHTGDGGIFVLAQDSLKPIFEGTGCFGLFFDYLNNMLFCATRTEPQILAFKAKNDEFKKIPVKFENYEFGNDSHGICVSKNRLFLAVTEGEKDGQKATNVYAPGDYVGKIIVSDLEIGTNSITVKNSKIYNPFQCSHHHHINDFCMINNSIFFSSFSYCDSNKNYIKKGVISRFNFDKRAEVLLDGLEQPHSLTSFRRRIYNCSSSSSKIISFDHKEKIVKLEYKGPDTFVRGVLPTDKFLYLGLSNAVGRTNSKFLNDTCALLRFDRKTGETKIFSIPKKYDNLYAIESRSANM